MSGRTGRRRREIARHRAWMMRGYAIGLGAGTQAMLFLFGELIFGKPDVLARALIMGAAWTLASRDSDDRTAPDFIGQAVTLATSTRDPATPEGDPDCFVHLHVHSEFSLLDGLSRIGDVTKRVAEQGMPAPALTDHGSMYGVIPHRCPTGRHPRGSARPQ